MQFVGFFHSGSFDCVTEADLHTLCESVAREGIFEPDVALYSRSSLTPGFLRSPVLNIHDHGGPPPRFTSFEMKYDAVVSS